jgi:hypothetical protein
MADEIDVACFEVARQTQPIDSEEIKTLARRYAAIARDRMSEELGIDEPLLARAIHYIGHVHAIPPMDDNVQWFGDMLDALVEVARPNAGLDDRSREFLRDMLGGIQQELDHNT